MHSKLHVLNNGPFGEVWFSAYLLHASKSPFQKKPSIFGPLSSCSHRMTNAKIVVAACPGQQNTSSPVRVYRGGGGSAIVPASFQGRWSRRRRPFRCEDFTFATYRPIGLDSDQNRAAMTRIRPVPYAAHRLISHACRVATYPYYDTAAASAVGERAARRHIGHRDTYPRGAPGGTRNAAARGRRRSVYNRRRCPLPISHPIRPQVHQVALQYPYSRQTAIQPDESTMAFIKVSFRLQLAVVLCPASYRCHDV